MLDNSLKEISHLFSFELGDSFSEIEKHRNNTLGLKIDIFLN